MLYALAGGDAAERFPRFGKFLFGQKGPPLPEGVVRRREGVRMGERGKEEQEEDQRCENPCLPQKVIPCRKSGNVSRYGIIADPILSLNPKRKSPDKKFPQIVPGAFPFRLFDGFFHPRVARQGRVPRFPGFSAMEDYRDAQMKRAGT